MRALVTGSRVPIAIEMVRKLGRRGHRLFATDATRGAPGSHSRYVAARFVTAAPRYQTGRYVDDIARALSDRPVDILIPSYEEVFYLARHRARLEGLAELFFPGFELLRRLHDKVAMLALARDLAIPALPALVAHSRAELADATGEIGQYFAHAAYSRGGATLYTNAGPLAGAVPLEACHPTRTNPFLVQPFVAGLDLCSQSIAHHGRVVAHAAYVHPVTLNHSTGTAFESVEDPETLKIAQTICEATGYHGQISIDFIRTADRLVLIEVNPRPSFGLAMMSDEMFDDALSGRPAERVRVAPAGVRRKMSLALMRNIAVRPWRAGDEFNALVHGGADLFFDRRDPLPAVYMMLAAIPMLRLRMTTRAADRTNLVDAFARDTTWDGERID